MEYSKIFKFSNLLLTGGLFLMCYGIYNTIYGPVWYTEGPFIRSLGAIAGGFTCIMVSILIKGSMHAHGKWFRKYKQGICWLI